MNRPLTGLLGILCLMMSSFASYAQYAVTPILPPPSFSFNDLWHLTVLRSQADGYAQFYLSLRVYNGNNQLKIKSNTTTLSLPVGSHYYNLGNISDLQPFSTSYYDASVLQQAVSSGGIFPPGTYNLAYTLYGKTADGEFVPLAEDATQAVVEALWPPMLLSPPDGDTLDTPYPLLTWTPAFNSTYMGPITYTLNLVELFNGQNAYQGIQANPNYFTQNGIPVTTLPYPAGAQALDTGKVYAWQVHADANGTPMGSSQIWTFTLANHTPRAEAAKANPVYFDIKHLTPFEVYYITDGYLYIKYEEEYATKQAEELRFEVLDKNFVPKNVPALGIPLSKGINRIKIDQCELNLGSIKEGDYFYFRASNKKGEKFTLKFFPKLDHTCH